MASKKLFGNTNALELYEDDFIIDEKISLKEIPTNPGMLLVYKSTCPYCIELKQLVKELSKELHKLEMPFYLSDQTDKKYLPIKTVPAFFFISEHGHAISISPKKRTTYEVILCILAELTKKTNRVLPNSLYNETNVVQLSHGDLIKTADGIKLASPGPPGLLKAYAHWCIFCKLKTELINGLTNVSPDINIYTLDLAEDRENPLNELVTGYPTFLYLDGSNYVRKIDNSANTSKIIEADLLNERITPEQKKQIIFAINSVMN